MSWKNEGFSLPSVLIVENKKGDVFIVENEKNANQIDKILGKESKPDRESPTQLIIK